MNVEMTTPELWAVLVGFLTPLLVAVVKQPRWSKQQKQVISIVVAVVVGVLNLLAQGVLNEASFTPSGALATLVLVLGASQGAYALLWKPTGVSDRIEVATDSETREGS